MFKKMYSVMEPGIMWYKVMKLTEKQVKELRDKGYTVERQ